MTVSDQVGGLYTKISSLGKYDDNQFRSFGDASLIPMNFYEILHKI